MKGACEIVRDFFDGEETAIWFIKCSGRGNIEPCAVYKYKDNFDVESLTRFMRNADLPMIVRHSCTCLHIDVFIHEGCHDVCDFRTSLFFVKSRKKLDRF